MYKVYKFNNIYCISYTLLSIEILQNHYYPVARHLIHSDLEDSASVCLCIMVGHLFNFSLVSRMRGNSGGVVEAECNAERV